MKRGQQLIFNRELSKTKKIKFGKVLKDFFSETENFFDRIFDIFDQKNLIEVPLLKSTRVSEAINILYVKVHVDQCAVPQ